MRPTDPDGGELTPSLRKMTRNRPLMELRNIGTTIAERLREAGIHDEADLRRVGAVGAHRLIRANHPTVTLPVCYYLYSFEGALTDRHWNELGEERKRQLQAQIH